MPPSPAPYHPALQLSDCEWERAAKTSGGGGEGAGRGALSAH